MKRSPEAVLDLANRSNGLGESVLNLLEKVELFRGELSDEADGPVDGTE